MKQKKEFSKWLLFQESILIWVLSLLFVILAFYCVSLGYMGSLPWVSAMVGLPWTAYGVSQAFYYEKSKKENCEGVTYQKVMHELNKNTTNITTNYNTTTYISDNDYRI